MNHPTTIIVMYVAKHTDGDGGNMTCMQCHACTWCLSVSLETIEIITLLYVCLSLVVKAYTCKRIPNTMHQTTAYIYQLHSFVWFLQSWLSLFHWILYVA